MSASSDSNKNSQRNKRKSKEKPTTSCSENVEQYLFNSTLHGLRYVGDRNISYFERIFFGLSFVFVIILSAYFISNIWYKWSATPIIIALNSKSTSISDIPFPAVTICNVNKAKQSRVEDFVKDSLDAFLLEGLCNIRDNLTSNDYSSTWPIFREFIINVSHSCKEMLLICKFASSVKTCMTLFDTSLTDEGLCCTFNQVDRKYLVTNDDLGDEWDAVDDLNNDLNPTDWTPENGFEITENFKNLHPRPGAGSGSHMGLTVVMNANIEEYYCTTTNSKGFKVLLHNPIETPQIENFGFSITPGFESRVIVTPRISDASDKVRPIPQSQRKCIFASEGNLSYFRTYTRKNCEFECQSSLIKDNCGCVLYYMPKMGNDTPICNRDHYDCYKDMIRAIQLAQNETFSCKCLPGCFELSYAADVSIARLGTDKFFTKSNLAKRFGAQFSARNIAIMHIYYEQNFFRSNSKEELIGFTEFLSNTGGLLGLFMGFSVVSLIEIIYFLTFRPYCNQRKHKKNQNNLNLETLPTSKKRTVDVEKRLHFSRSKVFERIQGRIRHKDLALFRPEIYEPKKRLNAVSNRFQYFE